ncbi:MAG: tripartite tricarboxylate transporter TctB family protein [Shewanella sp.]
MLNRDLIGSLLFIAVFTGYGVLAWQIPLLPFEEFEVVTSSTMPKIYASMGLMFSLFCLVAVLLKGNTLQQGGAQLTKAALQQTAALMVLMVLYAAGLEPLGFIAATFLFLVAGFWLMGERRFKILLLASVPVVLLFWVLMTQVLGIYLAFGSLWS